MSSSKSKSRIRGEDEGAVPGPSDRGDNDRSARRRLSHVSRACNACRRRKMRCDGTQPSCASCILYKEECVYNTEQDGRRPAAKAYVAALEDRVKVLERLLEKHGLGEDRQDSEEVTHTSNEMMAAGGRGDDAEGRAGSGRVDSGLDRLKIDDETGELLEYGPTSAFKHLAEPDRMSTSPPSSAPLPNIHLVGPAGAVPSPPNRRNTSQDNLQLSKPELDEETHNEVLRLFFMYFNPWCWWVDEAKFRRDMATCPPEIDSVIRPLRTANYGPLLHNAILSTGVAYLDVEAATKERLGRAFARRVRDLMEGEIEAPMLSTVVGLLLVGSHFSGSTRQSVGWVYAGTGLRLAQALGLGINCSYWVEKGVISEDTKRSRDRVFWTTYVQDKLWSTFVGRSAGLPISNQETPLPEPDPEEDAKPWVQCMNPSYTGDLGRLGKFEPELDPAAIDLSESIGSSSAKVSGSVPCQISTTFVYTAKLGLIADRVLSTVYSINLDVNSDRVNNVVSELDLALEKWHDSLPETLRITPAAFRAQSPRVPQPYILNLHAVYHFITILLHRPWYSRPKADETATTEDTSVTRCNKAASKILQVLNLFDRSPGLRYGTISLTQVTFTAGTIFLLSAAKSGSSNRQVKRAQSDMDAVKSCISALREMGKSWGCGAQSAAILSRLLDEWCPPELEPLTLPEPGPAGPVDIAQLLMNPAVAQQLRSLGWAPPPTPPGQPIMINQPVPMAVLPPTVHQNTVHPPAHNGLEGNLDWSLFTQFGLQPTNLQAGGGAVPAAPSVYDSLFGDLGNPVIAADTFHLGGGSLWPFGYQGGPTG